VHADSSLAWGLLAMLYSDVSEGDEESALHARNARHRALQLPTKADHPADLNDCAYSGYLQLAKLLSHMRMAGKLTEAVCQAVDESQLDSAALVQLTLCQASAAELAGSDSTAINLYKSVISSTCASLASGELCRSASAYSSSRSNYKCPAERKSRQWCNTLVPPLSRQHADAYVVQISRVLSA
jgi:hypothetical protein